MEKQELLNMASMTPRFTIEICNCEFGPHLEVTYDSTGGWVRWDDVVKFMKKAAK